MPAAGTPVRVRVARPNATAVPDGTIGLDAGLFRGSPTTRSRHR
ncbi:MAG TPA: hypothetical protein VGR62_15960 [Candidatus Binatia bacterium]|nr:hypothetical protein [Candidatus Binatia bacterium]